MQMRLDLSGGVDRTPYWVRQTPLRTSLYQRGNRLGARHHIYIDGKTTGYVVAHCGHPTALRPYYVGTPDGDVVPRKFSKLALAKRVAMALHDGETTITEVEQWLTQNAILCASR